MQSLRRGTVPPSWRAQYAARAGLSLGEWVTDLVGRTRALCSKYATAAATGASSGSVDLLGGAALMKCAFWVGGMFTPEAFVTATRQQTAQVSVTISLNYSYW